ncbi:peptide chain release factor N(5)-glutamine methyltransferase [Candidatus Saccharibacteria bacterium]|nr:peptide chain release factor N(5)-glutamine methyltransferase [Candidatus Saccharibacteria bacterium]
MRIKDFLSSTSLDRLDAELILCAVLDVDRAYLTAHDNEEIGDTDSVVRIAKRRLKGEPLAYILGYKDFYGRRFFVDNRVLVPRPETEQLIDLALETKPNLIIDVGTGSGIIAITMNRETKRPVFALDLSTPALNLAQKNAELHDTHGIMFMNSYLLTALEKGISIDGNLTIIANLPYVDREWNWISKEALAYEPEMALYANDHGLDLIKKLLNQIPKINFQARRKSLVLEADPSQHLSIIKYAKNLNFSYIKSTEFGILLTF